MLVLSLVRCCFAREVITSQSSRAVLDGGACLVMGRALLLLPIFDKARAQVAGFSRLLLDLLRRLWKPNRESRDVNALIRSGLRSRRFGDGLGTVVREESTWHEKWTK